MAAKEESSPVLIEVRYGIAFITLNRPDKMNAISKALALNLLQVLDHCKSPDIRCVCITGAGQAFCAGQDLAEATLPGSSDPAALVAEVYNPIVKAIQGLDKPVLAAVNGPAAGAGANMALCCDIVVAAESAYFLQAFTRIGLIPDTAGTYFLPRAVGLQKALQLMLLAEKLPAAEAERIGMIYKAIPPADFEATVGALAAQLASLPTVALALTKRALHQSLTNDLDQQLALEGKFQQQVLQTTDFREGVKAFMEKRKPVFTGN